MDVKGTAFIARKVMLIDEIGEERYNDFLAEFAKKEPVFNHPISVTTLIPLPAFIAFNEALVQTFYDGDETSYLRFGEKSAEYALTIGPYKRIREANSIVVFVDSARHVYQTYYNAGRAEGTLKGNVAELTLHGIAPEHRHISLEYAIAAYFRRGMEIVSHHSVSMKRMLGFSGGDNDIHYQYVIEATAAPEIVPPRRHG